MDLVIAVVIFGFIAVIFYSLVLIQQKPSIEELQQTAQTIDTKLEGNVPGCGQIISGQSVTPEQLQCLYGLNYAQVKQQLGINANFCIYVQDSSGRIYLVGNNSYGNKTGFGDPSLIIAGVPCGQAVT